MYNFKEVEKKWKKYWEDNQTFKTDVYDFSKPKYYVLDMFPYPSGKGLHVGHMKGYTASDVIARMKRMQGYNVLHPIGFDAFGLPAEQYAVKTGNNPATFTYQNINNFIVQFKNAGLSFDWSKQIATCDKEYYKWTQWIFEKLYEAGLAKHCDMPVNWCEELGTVLANDEVIDGKSERGGYPVIRKNMKQWTLNIVDYAEKLLDGLNEVDFPASTIETQRNWIGKSIGTEITFKVADSDLSFQVFTTRADTLFGATYCVLAPEHKLVKEIVTPENKEAVENYIAECAKKSDLERTELSTEKTGVFTGAYAINPVNNEKLPIYIADYVLVTYAFGALMAVPAHDERDFEFAKKFNLPIKQVLVGGDISKEAFVGDGEHINSGFLDGLNRQDATDKMIEWLEEHKCGKKTVKYKMREWIFGRQHFWGEPIPIIHMEDGEVKLVPENELPLELPQLADFKPHNGESALSKATDWVNVIVDGKKGRRETTTMPSSAGSSWYFLRYIDPHNNEKFADEKLLKHWLPVDLYVGGAEHATGHLLYSRFWNRFLYDNGYVFHNEQFKKLVHQGMMLGSNNEKMSKSKGNVVNPDDVIENYGSDVLKIFEMFMGPVSESVPWNEKGIDGSKRFLDKIYRIFIEENKVQDKENKNLEKIYHKTVKKVTNDFENLSFNTAISQMMIFMNEAQNQPFIPREYAEGFIKLLSPVAPCLCEEIWNLFGHKDTIAYESWPSFDEEKAKDNEYELVIQINGKLRDKVVVDMDTDEQAMKEIALKQEKIKEFLSGKEIVKIIPIKNRLVNIVIKN